MRTCTPRFYISRTAWTDCADIWHVASGQLVMWLPHVYGGVVTGFLVGLPFSGRTSFSLCLSVLSVWGRSVTGEHIGLCITGWDSRFRWMKKGSQEAIIWAGLGCHALSLPLSSPKIALPFVLTGTYLIAYRLWFSYTHLFAHSLDSFPLLSRCHLNSHIINSRVPGPLVPSHFPLRERNNVHNHQLINPSAQS